MKSSSIVLILFLTLFLLAFKTCPAQADTIICNNETVSTGASKAEVLNICGKPITISRDTIKNENWREFRTEETWTYIIDGCYREFVFDGNKLYKIINGRVAR